MNRFFRWLKNLIYQNIIIVENINNSKITVNGKVLVDDTKIDI